MSSETIASLKLGASLDGGQQVVDTLKGIGNESDITTSKVEKGAEKSTRAYNNLSTTLRKIRVDAMANGDALQKAIINAQVRNPDLDITKYQQEINWTKQALDWQEKLNASMKREQEEARKTAQEYAALQKQIDQAISKAESGMSSTSASYLSNLAGQRNIQLSDKDKSDLHYLQTLQNKQAQEKAIQQQLAQEAKQLQSQQDNFKSQLERLISGYATAGMSASQAMEYRIKQAGHDLSAYTPQLEELRKLEQQSGKAGQAVAQMGDAMTKGGMSAKQYAAAMRGVPAQMTDIFVSLAGGQAPLTVLLQQGGQLKDMFGGVKEALSALGEYAKKVIPMIVNVGTVTAAAFATVGYALYQGSDEQERLQRSLIATGGACGMTSTALNQLATSVGESTGKWSEAREAVEAFVASTKFDSSQIEAGMKGIADAAFVTGKSVQEIVKDFEALGDRPSEGVLKLNDRINFLTADLYKQIVALEKAGRAQEANRIILEQYSATMQQRSAQIVANAGYIERAWWAVRSAILGAWEALKGFGRDNGRANAEQIISNIKMSGDDPRNSVAGQRAMEQLVAYKALEKASQTHQQNLQRENNEIKKISSNYKQWQKDRNKKPKTGGGAKSNPEVNEYQNLVNSIKQKTEAVKEELQYGEKLNDAEKLRIKINNNAIDSKKKLSEAHKKELLEMVDKYDALIKERDAKKFLIDYEKKYTEQKEKLIQKYRDEIDVIGMGSKEAEAYKQEMEIARRGEEALKKAIEKGVDSAGLEKIKNDTQELIDKNKELRQQYMEKWNDPWTAIGESMRKYKEDALDTGKQVRDAMSGAFSAMEDSFVSFVTTGKFKFNDLINSILQDIARLMAKRAVTSFLDLIMNVGANAFSSWMGSNTGGGTQTTYNNPYASNSDIRVGYRASGGPVNSGSPYIIGERGPELFVPNQSGRVIPNNQLEGAVGAGGFNIQISHRNEGTQQQVTSSGADFDGKNLIIKIVTQDIANDGMISRTMSKTFGMRRAAGAM